MLPRLLCVMPLLVEFALLFQTASAIRNYSAIYSNELKASLTPCRSWIFPCGGGTYQCSTQDVYYQFNYGPQPGCPSLENSTATPPPETTCSLSNDSCSFVAGAPTCVSWLQNCHYEYSCTTEEEFSVATSEEEVPCYFPGDSPPSPDSICIPVNNTCEWYNPCRMWQNWCGGDYVCGTASEYAAFIYGPQPLCVSPAPNATEPKPSGECVYQDGQCVWSDCVSWLSPCQTSWECGSDYEYRVAQAQPLPPCPYPGEYFEPPTEPGVCQFVLESGICEFHGQPECTGGKEYQSCGSPCPLTCENYFTDYACPLECVPGCFCPGDKVLHEGECISSYECPSGIDPCGSSCAPGYECLIYEETGETYCSPNCDRLNPCEPDERCVLINVTCFRPPCPPVLSCGDPCETYGTACPPGYECRFDENAATTYCSPISACTGGKEWQDCGTACPLSCSNYSIPFGCTEQCVPGCFCPDGTVLSEYGECVPISDCPNYYSPCAAILCAVGYTCVDDGIHGYCEPSCYGYYSLCEEDERCELVEQECEEGDICPRTYRCVKDVCSYGGKELQDCGTACPLTCDNYDDQPLPCTLQCVRGCFCPYGKADLNGVCVEPYSCSDCDRCREGETCIVSVDDYGFRSIVCKEQFITDRCGFGSACAPGYECLIYEETGVTYCSPNCDRLNPCKPDERCVLTNVTCFRSPCPPTLSCEANGGDGEAQEQKVSVTVAVSSVVAVFALCSVLLLILIITVIYFVRKYKLKTRNVPVDGKEKPHDTLSYVSLVSKSDENDYEN